MKILVPGLIVFTIWCIISVRWYVCGIYELCAEDTKSSTGIENQISVEEESLLREPESRPLSFEWSAASPITSDKFDWFLDSLIQVFNDSPASVVQITGLYDPQEVNNSEFENLGLARAENIKQLLLSSGIKRSFRTRAEEKDLSSRLSGNVTRAYHMELVPQEEVTSGFLITEARGKIVIHFPSDKVTVNADPQVRNALKKLAQDAVKNHRKLLVVGHTDNQGDAMDNMKVGLVRATNVKDLLLLYGMNENDVLAESEGERIPLVSNTSSRGRQQNRRVEITLI